MAFPSRVSLILIAITSKNNTADVTQNFFMKTSNGYIMNTYIFVYIKDKRNFYINVLYKLLYHESYLKMLF